MPAKVNISVDDLNKMRRLYEGGKSFKSIAEEYSIAKNTVRKYLLIDGVVPDRKRSQSNAMIGMQSPRKGKHHTEETKALLSKIHKGRMPTTLGKVYSIEERKRISDGLKKRYAGGTRTSKGVTVNLLSDEEKIVRAKTRSAIKRLVSRILKMARIRKDRRSEELLGYTKQDLRCHLESQFTEGMSWANRNSFHIDHIIPVAEFFRRGIFDVARINALSNLQVLSPIENHRKSDKVDKDVLTAHFGGGPVTYTRGLA